jgi:hypothetical protein
MKFSPPPSTVTLGSTCRHPISRPFRPRRPTAASLRQGRAAAGQGPHSARTETGPPPPSSACPGRPPLAPPVFSLCSTEKPSHLLTELPSPAPLLPRRAPPKSLLPCCLSPSAPKLCPTKLPTLAASSCWTKLPQPNHRRLSVYAVTVSFRSSEPGQDPKLAGEQLPSLSSSHTPLFPSLCSLPMRKTKTEGGHRCHAPELAVSQSTACWCRCSGEHLRSRPCSECSPHLPLSLTSILAPVQPRELAAARHSFQQPTCAMATPRRQ